MRRGWDGTGPAYSSTGSSADEPSPVLAFFAAGACSCAADDDDGSGGGDDGGGQDEACKHGQAGASETGKVACCLQKGWRDHHFSMAGMGVLAGDASRISKGVRSQEISEACSGCTVWRPLKEDTSCNVVAVPRRVEVACDKEEGAMVIDEALHDSQREGVLRHASSVPHGRRHGQAHDDKGSHVSRDGRDGALD